MTNPLILRSRPFREVATTEQFLQSPDNKSFTELFLTFRPQLMSFFRALGCNSDLSDDLSQEVMLTVYQKSSQLRDRTRFRAWLFTIGRNALHRHYKRQSPEADSFDFDTLIDPNPPGSPAFEFHRWMTVLKPHETLSRATGVPRDRCCTIDPGRNRPVASVQCEKKARHTPARGRAPQEGGSLNRREN